MLTQGFVCVMICLQFKPEEKDVTWMQYIKAVKETLDRELTTKEVSVVMQSYINGVKVDKAVEKIDTKVVS